MKYQTARETIISAKHKQNTTITTIINININLRPCCKLKASKNSLLRQIQAAGIKSQQVLLKVPNGVLALPRCSILSWPKESWNKNWNWKRSKTEKQTNYKMIGIIHLRCCFQYSRPSAQCRCSLLGCCKCTQRCLQDSPSKTSKCHTLEPAWRLQGTLQMFAPELGSKCDL